METGEHARLATALQRHLGEVTAEQWLAAFHGPDRAAQDEAARAACAAAGVSLLHVDLAALAEREAFDHDVRLVFREAALRGAAVLLDGADAVARDGDKGGARARASTPPCWRWGGSPSLPAAARGSRRTRSSASTSSPGSSRRPPTWNAGVSGTPSSTATRRRAARRTWTSWPGSSSSPGEIKNAASVARTLALLRGDPGSILERGDLQQACRAESNPRLLSFGRRVRARYDWDELVLPPEQKTQLREIVEYVRHHEAVYTAWGFGDKHAMGRGTNVLFSGPSGTGKTMAAEIIAGDLGLDLYQDRPLHGGQQIHRRDGEEPEPRSSRRPRRATRSSSSTRPTPSSASARR